ncbi:MAG: hypothetical protein WCA22_03020 [Candidatus Binatus sp.]
MDDAFADANAEDCVRLWRRKRETAIRMALPSLEHFPITRTFAIDVERSIGPSFCLGFRVLNR